MKKPTIEQVASVIQNVEEVEGFTPLGLLDFLTDLDGRPETDLYKEKLCEELLCSSSTGVYREHITPWTAAIAGQGKVETVRIRLGAGDE